MLTEVIKEINWVKTYLLITVLSVNTISPVKVKRIKVNHYNFEVFQCAMY